MTRTLENVPVELCAIDQWVCWRLEDRDGKSTKVPYRAGGEGRASTTDPATWTSLALAVEASAHFDGVGFVFTAADPFVGVDFDGCRLPNGLLEPGVASLVLLLDSYSEWSLSGQGVHVITVGEIGGRGRRNGGVEVYSHGRYFAMTGDHIVGTPREIR